MSLHNVSRRFMSTSPLDRRKYYKQNRIEVRDRYPTSPRDKRILFMAKYRGIDFNEAYVDNQWKLAFARAFDYPRKIVTSLELENDMGGLRLDCGDKSDEDDGKALLSKSAESWKPSSSKDKDKNDLYWPENSKKPEPLVPLEDCGKDTWDPLRKCTHISKESREKSFLSPYCEICSKESPKGSLHLTNHQRKTLKSIF